MMNILRDVTKPQHTSSSMTTETMTQKQTPKELAEKQIFLTMVTCLLLMLFIQNAFAAGTPSVMGDTLCNIVWIVYGNLGRGLASLAVIIIGVGALLGKTSWGLAMTVAVGISIIFNAGTVVTYLGAGTATC